MVLILEGLEGRMRFKPCCDDRDGSGSVQVGEDLATGAVEAFFLHTCDVTQV
jgi:hypothetical protein